MKLIKQLILIFSLMSLLCISGFAQEGQTYFLHTVQAGQSLYSIAEMYNVPVSQIVKLNSGSEETIYTGQVLHIPQQKGTNTSFIFHTIQSNETLYRLSVNYKVSAQDICDLNPGLTAENFHSGEVIRIPLKKSEATTVITTVSSQQTVKKAKETPRCKDMHKVKGKETVYSICKKYHITDKELIAANPDLQSTGLQKGNYICIPYPSPKKPVEIIPSNNDLFEKLQHPVKQIGTIKVAIVLPFSKYDRMVEYYEGLLLAVDSLKRCGVSMDIYAYDTRSGINNLIADKPELADMDIIFGPLDKEQIKPLADFAKSHQIRLVIPFTSKDNEVFRNPYVYQVNTPQVYLYSSVYNYFLKRFSHPNVIFLESNQPDHSKDEFIKGLKSELRRNGVPCTSISDNSSLETMADALFPNRENLFIPTSGSHVTLIKILPKMELLVRNNRSSNICLFGYPEWQTLTKEHLKQFFAVNTYFYSSFYTNNLLPEAKRFERSYRNCYHKLMADRYPKFGMLGFDTGYFFLKGLSQYGSSFEKNVDKMRIIPIQTGFLFKRVNNWGGFINQKVFFVHYTPQSEVVKIDFD